MEITLAGGAVLDIATRKDVSDIVDGALRRVNSRNHTMPRRDAKGANIAAGFTGYVPIDCGGPSNGRVWDVRALSVTLIVNSVFDVFQAQQANVLAAFLATPSQPQAGMFDAGAVITAAAAAPFDRKFGAGQAPILAPDHLWCWVKVTQAVAGLQAVIANFAAIDAREDSELTEGY